MKEMKSLTLNDKTYDCFVDDVARSAVVVSSASGENIVVSDSSDLPLVGLNLYGKSTQDDTPTPEAPVDIVSVGDDGTIKCWLFGKNLFDASKLGLHKNTSLRVLEDGYTIIATGGKGATYTSSRCELPLAPLKGQRLCLTADYIEKTGDSGSAQITIVTPSTTFYYNVYEQHHSVAFTVPIDATSVSIGIYTNNTNVGLTSDNTVTVKGLRLMLYSNKADGWTKAVSSQEASFIQTLRGVPVIDKNIATHADASGQMWCADEIDLARGLRVQRVSENASLTFGSSGTANGNVYVYSAYLYGTENVMNTRVISTHFKWVESGALAYMSSGTMFIRNTDSSPVVYCASTISTADGFNAWVRENNVRFLSVMATPIETTLTDEEIAAYKAMHTNKPNTTVLNDEGAYMSLKYIADPKAYIDNKVSGILAATVE